MPAASTNVRTCCRPRFAPPVSEGSWHACIAAPRPRDDQRARRADEGSRGAQRSAPTPCRVDKKRPGARGTLPPSSDRQAPTKRVAPHANAAAGRPPSHAPDPLCVFFWDQDKGGGNRESGSWEKGGESRGESKHSTQRASESERGSLASLQQCSRGQGRAGHFACRVRGRYYIDGPQPRPENTHAPKKDGRSPRRRPCADAALLAHDLPMCVHAVQASCPFPSGVDSPVGIEQSRRQTRRNDRFIAASRPAVKTGERNRRD